MIQNKPKLEDDGKIKEETGMLKKQNFDFMGEDIQLNDDQKAEMDRRERDLD